MAEYLPRMWKSMCKNEQTGCKNDDFRLNTTGSYRVARLYLGSQYIELTLLDLQYLSRMFHVVQNQLRAYIHSLTDVLSYDTVALSSCDYVEPAPNTSKHILHSQVFDELKTVMN